MYSEDGIDADIQFDPLAEDTADDLEDEEVAFIGLIEKPVDETAPIAKEPQITPKERILALLDSIPGQRKLMLSIIGFCRDPQSPSAVDAFTTKLQENYPSVYTPVVLRQHLEAAGALLCLDVEPTPEHEISQTASTDSVYVLPDISNTTVKAFEQSLPSDADPLYSANSVFDATSDVDTPQIEYLEVTRRPEWVWVSTEAAIDIYDNLDYMGDLHKMLMKDPEYYEIFVRILRYCDEAPRTKPQLNDLVDNDPVLLGPPRLYSGYFIDQLEKCGALEWISGWVCTTVGHDFVAELDSSSTK